MNPLRSLGGRVSAGVLPTFWATHAGQSVTDFPVVSGAYVGFSAANQLRTDVPVA
ncbi:hypothetical protein [Deinococcus maricopensis]|uniref:Uncharacterized protein n=1 Tax=Deinococcus maricopensis (strain DSM 21211 / LMG 22137 / NRRL B-23946 / LB-34) TaxID=709986 RepID=E8U5F3_DEIML|nr:hypothetical protein [Deinococcus maricopensis]ADV66292.1 hypothetical protein Deima_0635 [Deinococcus maricopensis DSM 21211]